MYFRTYLVGEYCWPGADRSVHRETLGVVFRPLPQTTRSQAWAWCAARWRAVTVAVTGGQSPGGRFPVPTGSDPPDRLGRASSPSPAPAGSLLCPVQGSTGQYRVDQGTRNAKTAEHSVSALARLEKSASVYPVDYCSCVTG